MALQEGRLGTSARGRGLAKRGFFICAGPIVKGWPISIEVQGHFGDAGSIFGVRGGKVSGAKRGPIVKNRIPFGDWDKYEITSKGGKVTVVSNGELVNEGYDITPLKEASAFSPKAGRSAIAMWRSRSSNNAGHPSHADADRRRCAR
jgi:hypothetical protein